MKNDILEIHSYKAVINEIWKKIRKGGWLMGDDYNSTWPSKKDTNKMNLKVQLLYDSFNKYPIYYFIKN